MLLTIVALAYLAFWAPSWRSLAIVTVVLTIIRTGVLAWTLGFFAPGVDYGAVETAAVASTLVRAIAVEMVIFVALAIAVVWFFKGRREEAAREAELLARLLQQPPRNNAP